jgi:hypothetical protein
MNNPISCNIPYKKPSESNKCNVRSGQPHVYVPGQQVFVCVSLALCIYEAFQLIPIICAYFWVFVYVSVCMFVYLCVLCILGLRFCVFVFICVLRVHTFPHPPDPFHLLISHHSTIQLQNKLLHSTVITLMIGRATAFLQGPKHEPGHRPPLWIS